MNKLKNKVFSIIFLLLSFGILSFILLFNIQKYIELKSSIKDSLNINSKNKQDEKPSNET